MVGLIENMSGFSIDVKDVTWRDRETGVDSTALAMDLIVSKCPELLSMKVRAKYGCVSKNMYTMEGVFLYPFPHEHVYKGYAIM